MASFTKQAIRESFLRLLDEYPLRDITVKMIVEMAAVFSLRLCGIGMWLILKSGGFLHHGSRWWKNAGSYLVNGAVNGATVAIFMSFMVSCMSGLGTAGYTGAARLG